MKISDAITILLAISLGITATFSVWEYNSYQQLDTRLNTLNQSFVSMNYLYNERNLLYTNLWNQFYSGGIVANLSNSGEFKFAANERGAKYFSISPDIGFSNTGATVDGYIWDENGTFILSYSALVEFPTFQVRNIMVYEPICIGCPENVTITTPSMSNYTIYIIQGTR
jgi:hypothetical protein